MLRGVPVISWEYCYLGSQALGAETLATEQHAEAEGQNPLMVMHDGAKKGVYAMMHKAKGIQFPSAQAAVSCWAKVLDRLAPRGLPER